MPDESHNRENFVNNASLSSAQENETKHVIVSESETIQPIANQKQLQGVDMGFNSSPQRGEEAILSEQTRTLGVQVRGVKSTNPPQSSLKKGGSDSRHTEEQHLQSAECRLKTQAVCKTFQPNVDTFNANVVIDKRKYPVTNTKELSCKKDNYIEITNQLDCFGSKEPHNDVFRHSECNEESHSCCNLRGYFAVLNLLHAHRVSYMLLCNSVLNLLAIRTRFTPSVRKFAHAQYDVKKHNVGKLKCKVAFTLTEGATHVAHWKNSRKIAFTLAEVLITLGIIGVVAAMTLPTVIANYQKHVTVTKLEKAYTTLNQAFKLSEVNNESSEHWDNAFEIGADNYFNKYWKPYLNGVEVCKKYQDCGYNSNTPFYTLKGQVDGVTVGDSSHSRILFRINSDTVYLLFASMGTASITGSQPSNHVWIDINGGKGPNMFGKDVFQFRYVTGEGIVPSGIDYPNYVRTSCSKNQGKGDYCAAKIVQDGWKIADDYPW